MNKIEKNIIKDFRHSQLYKIIIIYIIFGLFIFSIGRSDLSYLNLIIYSTSHPYVIAIFLVPSIISVVYYLNNNYFLNYNLIIRNHSRKKYIKVIIKSIIIITTDIFIIYLLSSIILANIFANRDYFITQDKYYHIPNIIILIINILKNYFFIFITGIFASTIDRKNFIIRIIIIILTIISFLGVFPNLILPLFPSYYVSSYHVFSNIYYDVIFTTGYFIIILIINLIILIKHWKKDLL